MTLILLDTNAYLRLAKRVKPMLGVKFGQKEYSLTVLREVEKEVQRSPTLKFKFPWFDHDDIKSERLSKVVRLTKDEKGQVRAATSVLRALALDNTDFYISNGWTPPSEVDCWMLAFGQIRPAIVATDDLGMHHLAREFGIKVFHGHELLKKMLSAKLIDKEKVREIYEALENNDDLPKSWQNARHVSFNKVFGSKKKGLE